MKKWKQRIFSTVTSMAMMLSVMPVGVQAATADIYKEGAETPIFCQFYAQNQSGNWDWMSAGGQNLKLGEKQTLEFSALDADGNSKFAVAAEDASFGFQFGDSKIIAGDTSNVKLTLDEITIKANGYDDLVIDPEKKDYDETYVPEEVSWGIQGNTTSVDLKSYLGDDFLPYLNAITSFEATVTLNDYTFTAKPEEEKPVEDKPVVGEATYQKGDKTELFTQFYLQENGGDWSWYSPGSQNLVYDESNTFTFSTLNEDGTSIFANAGDDYRFGLQFGDSKLKDGDRGIFTANVDEIVMKAEGYDDVVVKLDPSEYKADYVAQEQAWGIDANTTMISLRDYVPGDFVDYVKALTSLQVTISANNYTYVQKPAEEPEFPEGYQYPTEMRGLTAKELVAEMGVGWNLGNTLDSNGGETAWGNPKTTRKMIDAVKAAGFNTIRIPITWDNGAGEAPDYKISDEYFDRIQTVVNYAMINDMYAIINIHHSTTNWFFTTPELADAVPGHYAKLWEQIADRFKDYGDKLIFETANEPRNSDEDWTGDERAYDVVNQINKQSLAAMRASGGNNADRLVMMPTYAASSYYACMEGLEVPDDDMIAVSIHAYLPYSFAMDTKGTSEWGTDADKKELANVFDSIDKQFMSKGIPVVIGEFASTNKGNTEARAAHAKYYAQLAKSYNIPCLWWDNGANEMNAQDSVGLLDRKRLEWVYPELVKALVEGYYGEGIEIPEGNLIFKGEATSKEWGQAVSLIPGKDIMLDKLNDDMQIAVAYKSEKAPELILQSWSGGPQWVQVAPSKVMNGVAYYTYKDMVAAYAAATEDYESYGKAFPMLDQIHIGDTGVELTVTKVYFEEVSDPSIIFKGEATADPWGQALSFAPGSDIKMSELGKNVKIAVTYESETTPEFILQSWSGGPAWLKISPAEVKDGVAYFTYEDMVKGYAAEMKDYESYGKAFPLLDKVYIGATDAALTVTKVKFIYPVKVEDAQFNELPTLYENDTLDLNDYLVVLPDNATDKSVSKWESSNTKVATVDENGQLVAVAPGYTTITATLSDNDMQVTYDLEVAIKFASECKISPDWGTGLNAEIVLTNTQEQAIKDWTFEFEFAGNILSMWNGEVISHEGTHYVVKNLGWNKDIAAGDSISIGFSATYEGDATEPTGIKFLNAVPKDSNFTYEIAFDVTNSWEDNFTSELKITNTSEETIQGWSLEAEITGKVTQIWGGTITSQDGNKYVIANADYNKDIAPGETVVIGLTGTTDSKAELVGCKLVQE